MSRQLFCGLFLWKITEIHAIQRFLQAQNLPCRAPRIIILWRKNVLPEPRCPRTSGGNGGIMMEQLYHFSAPGRTEISGNHTDHQHGCV
ncbi:MAG: galactokinase family protein, partial [Clostridiales bacterium]|nr:galactokinase family protein [Clostridiales bacterium]